MTDLVGDGRGLYAHFKALWWQVPVCASPLACQLHARALILFHDLAQPKVLQGRQHRAGWELLGGATHTGGKS